MLGVKDGTKEVVGLDNILEDELKIANAIAASVSPLLIPSFQFSSWRHRDILIITIPHSFRPYFLTNKGEQDQIKPPKFEELGQFFRVTLYPRSTPPSPSAQWHIPIMEYLGQHESITAKTAQELWKISRRAASNRLKSMCEQGLLVEISTGPRDPYKIFILAKHRK